MIPHLREEFSTRSINWNLFVIMGNAMPPRDHPDEDEEDNGADEPPVVREPDED